MNAYNAHDLARSFQTVRNNTIKIAEEIPEEKYSFRPAEGTRTVAETLAHIAVLPNFAQQMHTERRPSLDFAGFAAAMQKIAAAEAALNTKTKILDALKSGNESFTKFLD